MICSGQHRWEEDGHRLTACPGRSGEVGPKGFGWVRSHRLLPSVFLLVVGLELTFPQVACAEELSYRDIVSAVGEEKQLPAEIAAGSTSTLVLRPFGIQVVDESTGRGVPLVELATVNGIRLVTDSNGWVAFYEPDLAGQDVFFYVRSHGYEYPQDGFGFAGIRLRVTPGQTAIIRIKRKNIAERLYRITGQGIYRDSVLLGQPVPPWFRGLAGGVIGCDSVLCALYRGKLYWFWGDTNRAGYPLGNFWTTGATSPLPDDPRVDPDVGIPFDYFVGEDGFVRGMAPLSRDGPVWLNGPVVLRDAQNQEQMFAHYMVVDPKSSSFAALERGLAVYNPQTESFEKLIPFSKEAIFPDGAHPILLSDETGEFVYFCNPFPLLRVRANVQDLQDPGRYESYSPLVAGSPPGSTEIDRSPAGKVQWAWKQSTDFVGPPQLREFVGKGLLSPQEAKFIVYDVFSGLPVVAHRGSMAWNEYRQCFVLVFTEIGGTSFLGEVWYAEADSLLGPWGYAQKIVTHDRYSFYNPKHHPFFDREGGRVIYFEGTYSATFSSAPFPTPYYDYNQVMYRLDLGSPRLRLPVPIYRLEQGGRFNWSTRWSFRRQAAPGGQPRTSPLGPVHFWAWDRGGRELLPVYEVVSGDSSYRLVTKPPEVGGAKEPAFYILSPEADLSGEVISALAARGREESKGTSRTGALSRFPQLSPVRLTEWQLPSGSHVYLLEHETPPEGAVRREVLGKVLPHPEAWPGGSPVR
ncbi:MAG: hypothetical protein NZ899_07910 [Thermoguttaceae bacterium]|nr:hypothetical protein [Thermoguttaceae bacterium]